MPDRFDSVPFDQTIHEIAAFASGEPDLDAWLKEESASSEKRRTSRTWVWADNLGAVVAYYTLSSHKVAREQVPTRIGRGGPSEIPAVLIGKLALAEALHGRGLGAQLVADALYRIVSATQTVAARLVVVDAMREEVTGFYERLGFVRVPGSLVLVQKVSDIEAALSEAL